MRSLTRTAAALLLCASSLAGAARAEGAQEPPPCTDKKSMRNAKRQYEGLEEQQQNLKIKALTDAKELHAGKPPPGVNQYATKTSYGTSSRWCQATMQLSNGKSDTLYWRMDYLVEGSGHSINLDHCATGHDLLDEGCEKHKSGK